MQTIPALALSNGVLMDQLGFGVYKVPPARTEELVGQALDAGYRSIDTAAFYANETGVGAAVRSAVAGGLNREDIFVTTKIWNDAHGYQPALRAFDASLAALGLDYVDLLLIHWPCPAQDLYVPTYRALENLYQQGRVRAIGVSNFEIDHLQRLLQETDVVPMVNQVELHPGLQQGPLRRFHTEHGIRTEAWSPLGRGAALEHPVVLDLARRYERTAAQIVLRWHMQLDIVAIPKASSADRIRQNRAVFDFELDEAAMTALAGLDAGRRLGSHPTEVN